MPKIKNSLRQIVIQLAGSGLTIEKIVEVLESKGIKVDLDQVVQILQESNQTPIEEVDVDDIAGVMRWLIKNQVKRVSKLLGVESTSPLPLPETTNNIKILAELLVKYGEMNRGGPSIKELKKSILGIGDEQQ